MIYTYELPICVYLPRVRTADKKVMINMNYYHTWHPQQRNQIKQLFEPTVSDTMPAADMIRITYTAYKKGKGRYDTMNIVSLVDKFFLDWLVKNGRLPDDTCLNVSYGGIQGFNNADRNYVIAQIEIIK